MPPFRNPGDSDRADTFDATAALALKADITFAQFVMMTPFPGTVDFNKWEKSEDKSIVAISYNTACVRNKPGISGHATVVVGRRFNEKIGQCEFEFRNSWGQEWGNDGHEWISDRTLSKCGKYAMGIDDFNNPTLSSTNPKRADGTK